MNGRAVFVTLVLAILVPLPLASQCQDGAPNGTCQSSGMDPETSCNCPEDCGAVEAETDCADGCTDGIDNDGDNMIDCADSDCSGDSNCLTEICDNGQDDDGDNLVDCVDILDCPDSACDDGNPCTDNDSCSNGICLGVNDDTNACSDGVACTVDVCSSGVCVGTPNCDDFNPCTQDQCNLQSGECENTAKDCSDGDPCTLDLCDGQTGDCSNPAVDCDDQDLCTVDSCDSQTGCVNAPSSCSDGDACTQDLCDPQTGTCSFPAVNCDDGVPCTLDSCNSQTGCVNAPDDEPCDDQDPLTTDTCDPVQGCVNAAFGAESNCSDGRDNNGDGRIDCDDPSCEGLGCNDGFACTVLDFCQAGACRGTPNHQFCDDGLFCTGDERCNPGSPNKDPDGCVDRQDPCQGFGERCDESSDQCREIFCTDGLDNDNRDGFDCNDSLDCPCFAGTVCDAPSGKCREARCNDGLDNDGDGAVDCDDRPDCDGRSCRDTWFCTDDRNSVCTGGSCPVGSPNDTRCDNGLFCDGRERCRPGSVAKDPNGCVDGGDPCPGVGVGCDEQTDNCTEIACTDGLNNDGNQGTDCNDPDCPCPAGSFCDTGTGRCRESRCDDGQDNDGNGLIDCVDPSCGGRSCVDAWACTDDANATCQNGVCAGSAPLDARCYNGLFCDGRELCRPGSAGADGEGCIDGFDPCTDPGTACREDQDRCAETACANGRDDDRDGRPDCQDDDCLCPDGTTCRAGGACPETDCANGQDDDEDGRADCLDQDCDSRDCDDGKSCTVRDTCIQGSCVGSRLDSRCDDGASCTRDLCDPEFQDADAQTGCRHLPVPSVCDDQVACTIEVCDPSHPQSDDRGCFNDPDDEACDDGLWCNGVETCEPTDARSDGEGCRPGANRCSDPGESCVEAEDRCREDACRDSTDNDDDGRVDCADSDCPPEAPEDCVDGQDNDCDTLVDCDDTQDCVFDRDSDGHDDEPCGGDCDDSDPTVNPGRLEACADQIDNDCDGLVDCLDEDECIVDDDQDGQNAEPCGEDCDDGDPEVFLRNVEDCNDGKDNDCDGLIDCVDPDCDRAPCDDGVACTIDDRCSEGACSGLPRDTQCDDQVACTGDRCVAGRGCEHTPRPERCDDGLFCNGRESCDPEDPLADSEGCVDNLDPCSGDFCDEDRDLCECVADPYESDDTCADARLISPQGAPQSEPHTLCPEGDLDRVRFDVEAGKEYVFFTTGSLDTLGILTNANCGQELARNNDCSAGDPNFCLSWTGTFNGQAVLTVSSGEAAAVRSAPGTDPSAPASPDDSGVARSASGADLLGTNRPTGKAPPETAAVQTGDYLLWFQSRENACLPDGAEPADSQCGTVPSITPVPAPQSEDHTVCPPGDPDGWRFRGEAGRTYRFQSFGDTDTKVQIRTEDCSQVLVRQEDCGGDANFCADFTPQTTDFYTVVVLGQTQATTGPYRFQYRLVEGGACFPDAAEPDDGCFQGVFLSVGPVEQVENRTLCPEGDEDTFSFNATAGRVYHFRTEGDLDTRMLLATQDCGTTLADESTCGPDALNACIVWRAPASGPYKLRVQGRHEGVTGTYRLVHVQEDCPPDGWEPDGACGQATPLDVDFQLQRQAHTLCPDGEIDLFEFFAEEGAVYHFYSAGSTDTGGAVVRADCKKFLKKDESSGAGENFDLRWRAPATGFYKLGVSGRAGPYDLFFQRVTDDGTACVEDGNEPDDVCAQGALIVPDADEASLDRSLCPPDDRDHFTFEARAGTTYRFWTEGDVDTVGSVRDAGCNILAGNDDCDLPNDLNTCLEWTAPRDGVFHVRVRGFSRTSTVGPYRFHYRILP